MNRPVEAVVLTSGDSEDENTLDEPTKVVPRPAKLDVNGDHFRHEFPGNSLTILRFKQAE